MKKRQNLKSGVSPLIDISNNNVLFSDLDKANMLNSYFSSIQQNDISYHYNHTIIMEIYWNFII